MQKKVKRIFDTDLLESLAPSGSINDNDLIVLTINKEGTKSDRQYLVKYSAFKTLILAGISDGTFEYDIINELTAGHGVIVDGVLLKDFQVNTDVINELTADTGVTIDGVINKNGGITSIIPNIYKGVTSITAFATGGIGSATILTGEKNEITICATAGDSVLLPIAALGKVIEIVNNGAASCDVFAITGSQINGAGSTVAVKLPAGTRKVYIGTSSTTWVTGVRTAQGLGTVALPAITFDAQPNMGIYWISATQMGISVSGALATLFDTSGIMTDSVRNRVNLGTAGSGTVSIIEYSNGKDVTTVLTLTNFIVGALAGAAAALGVGNIVYAFPAGQHFELVSSLSSIVLTATGTAVVTKTGLGSVIATGAVAVLSGTATFQDRHTAQDITTGSGGGAAVSSLVATTAGIGTGIALNIAASVKNVFLNSAGTWNANNTGNLTATGTIILKWTKMS